MRNWWQSSTQVCQPMGMLGKHELHEMQGVCSLMQEKTSKKIYDTRYEGTLEFKLIISMYTQYLRSKPAHKWVLSRYRRKDGETVLLRPLCLKTQPLSDLNQVGYSLTHHYLLSTYGRSSWCYFLAFALWISLTSVWNSSQGQGMITCVLCIHVCPSYRP